MCVSSYTYICNNNNNTCVASVDCMALIYGRAMSMLRVQNICVENCILNRHTLGIDTTSKIQTFLCKHYIVWQAATLSNKTVCQQTNCNLWTLCRGQVTICQNLFSPKPWSRPFHQTWSFPNIPAIQHLVIFHVHSGIMLPTSQPC